MNRKEKISKDRKQIETRITLAGGQIEPVRRTGEHRAKYRTQDGSIAQITYNGRRKDACAKLVWFAKKIFEVAAANDPSF